MSWTDFISHLLATTHKIEKVAVFNADGHPLAVTEDLQVSLPEGQALVRCLSDPARTLTKLHLDNNFYTCFQGNDITVIGTSPGRDNIFVAHKSDDCIIVVFGRSAGHGSFLFELKKNLWQKHHRHFEQIPGTRDSLQDHGKGGIQQMLHEANIQMSDDQAADDSVQQTQVADDQICLQIHG